MPPAAGRHVSQKWHQLNSSLREVVDRLLTMLQIRMLDQELGHVEALQSVRKNVRGDAFFAFREQGAISFVCSRT
jgi:hypothetical protein